jgi:hypothetical protein
MNGANYIVENMLRREAYCATTMFGTQQELGRSHIYSQEKDYLDCERGKDAVRREKANHQAWPCCLAGMPYL